MNRVKNKTQVCSFFFLVQYICLLNTLPETPTPKMYLTVQQHCYIMLKLDELGHTLF